MALLIIRQTTHTTDMALQHAPRTFSRFIYLFQNRRGLADALNSGAHRRGSCVPTETPECPPCEPRPPPPCREPTTSCPSGLRVVCCAPPVGQRPPCHPPQPPVSLTCNNINKQEKISTNCKIEVEGRSSNACGAQLDRVARRLEAAERIRRLEYESEVAKQLRASSTPLVTPTYSYRLAEERECMRATDGQDYTVTKLNKNERRCDASRNPPPPCPIPLDPVDNCKIKRDTHLDPCSHHPRIFVEIDRSQSLATSTKPSVPPAYGSTDTTPKRCTSSGNLTSRIIESFKHHESKSEVREVNEPKNIETDSKRGIDQNLCSKFPLPKHVPPRCKEPSLIERLRRRSGGARSKTDNPRRQLHTGTYIYDYRFSHSSSNPMAFQQKVGSNEDKLNSLLQERSHLSEVGRGRVTTSHENTNDDKCIGAGGIELKVPPSTEAVRVRVLLDFNTAMPMSCAKNTVLNPASNRYNNVTNGSETWLSIKNLQKKLKGCRKSENTIEPKKADERKSYTEPKASHPKQNPCVPQNAISKTSHTPTCPKSSHRSSNTSPCNERPSKSTTKFIDTQNYPIFPF